MWDLQILSRVLWGTLHEAAQRSLCTKRVNHKEQYFPSFSLLFTESTQEGI